MTAQTYSIRNVQDALIKAFHQYLQAQYHIWDEPLIAERKRIMQQAGYTFQEPRLEATPQYAEGHPYNELGIPATASSILQVASKIEQTGIPKTPYAHQCFALEGAIGRSRDLIVATGTGSGKTESFLMPIISGLALESAHRPNSWAKPAVRALLLYPMNALVNDQLSRLRRLLGDPEVSDQLRGANTRRATFGMYTSRTPYPGRRTTAKDRNRAAGEIMKLYFNGMTDDYRNRLKKEGKWPAKDLEAFLLNSLETGPNDVELLTRHEMQVAPPDLLVTNYSMLEYMMLRPIEAEIFETTRDWLQSDPSNVLTIVLDEAHMYRGAGGAEVAYLLRRLQARLRVPREKIRYILTSASLGSSEEAHREVKEFAADLTGGRADQFELITSQLLKWEDGTAATAAEQGAFEAFDYSKLLGNPFDRLGASVALTGLGLALGLKLEAPVDTHDGLQQFAHDLLHQLPVASLVAGILSSFPTTLSSVSKQAFPHTGNRENAAEALMALMAFGKDVTSGRPFCPIRAHLLYQGLVGLYACTNSSCSLRKEEVPSALGRLHADKRLYCDCGARVYELLTHRTCGAAYIRGYVRADDLQFLWHEASNGTWSEQKLVEAQFYVIPRADLSNVSARSIQWLHTPTGRLLANEPSNAPLGLYLPLLSPDLSRLFKDRGKDVFSHRSCPACRQVVRSELPIAMDLATKGEAPFAHIIRAQVAAQPLSSAPTPSAPNGGRKTLIFSDGRQKAARLARDIPRELQLDLFRQAMFIAALHMKEAGKEPRLDRFLYVGFLKCLNDYNLTFFDGQDQHRLELDVTAFREVFNADIVTALDEDNQSPPPSYSALLLQQLGTPFYSISALTLGYAKPSRTAWAQIRRECHSFDESLLQALSVLWIQRLLSRFSFDANLPDGVRSRASRFPYRPTQARDGFSREQSEFLSGNGIDVDGVCTAFSAALCQPRPDGSVFLNPSRIVLHAALTDHWVQCDDCRTVSPVLLFSRCPNCTSAAATLVDPETTSYLRARKGFWRDPVVFAVAGKQSPMSIDVQEHTAQLSYKDADTPAPTTEIFERKFRDILRAGERAVDVLSCTTTMEVGIDIGSLLAVAMRNVPPMRQNYQQRAGRAGRRGSAVSTVVTYAQTGAHDSHYFSNPDKIIAGDPPKPVLDIENERIAIRHVYAQLLQDFFRPLSKGRIGRDIFTALGNTWSFYNDASATSFAAFQEWLRTAPEGQESLDRSRPWLPKGLDPSLVPEYFVDALERIRPRTSEGLEPKLIEFLFGEGLLPSYAFPRDLCSLQIQQLGGSGKVRVLEQAQQGMNAALSEYAPGRLVVVNKKTYRVGTVASSGLDTEVDRGEPLFHRAKVYRHCTACTYSEGFVHSELASTVCPQCGEQSLFDTTVIRPEVVYPRGATDIDEFDDEQIFTHVTQAQLPLPDSERQLPTREFSVHGRLAATRTQSLVVVNDGDPSSQERGFLVCDKCGKVLLGPEAEGPHSRDYYVKSYDGRRISRRCDGAFHRVFLGYDFRSDVLLLRISIEANLRFNLAERRMRKPLEDALRTLCDALTLAISRRLDVDVREVSAGFRFGSDGKSEFADVFVYDTLSGGAGYALEAEKAFGQIFEDAVGLMKKCACSTSCDRCLRHYGNRFHHSDLDRHLGLELAQYVLHGDISAPLTMSEQRDVLRPLVEMVKLAGWELREERHGVEIEHAGKRIVLKACASLRAEETSKLENGRTVLTFTPYELSRDLPSAFAELS